MKFEDCKAVLSLVDEAVAQGCRQLKACEAISEAQYHQLLARMPKVTLTI